MNAPKMDVAWQTGERRRHEEKHDLSHEARHPQTNGPRLRAFFSANLMERNSNARRREKEEFHLAIDRFFQ
ncbi:hypothetical protein KSF_087650 [Reticulibacter mediterranei]|uniref:Uncharacterized protein n=1 Tax=Reticulibacter mediterranei TaxID=2778369 RepID=A0A8J3N8Y5_9CHLR|nr:hypothetical protein KSF_087650 [Reticulibacter mediterranei]